MILLFSRTDHKSFIYPLIHTFNPSLILTLSAAHVSSWDDEPNQHSEDEDDEIRPGEEGLTREEIKKKRKAEFKKRRAAHYNEFQTFKQLQQAGVMDVDDEED